MNMAEALSREVERVTELRALYRTMENQPQIIVAPAIMMMDMALEKAHLAAGTNDALEVIRAYEDLKGFEK